MDFTQSERSQDLSQRLAEFIDQHVRPAEATALAERAAHPDQQPGSVEQLKQRAKQAGLWNLCVRSPDHGPGLSFVDYAPLAEQLGVSPLAQEATNCDAPTNINGDAMILYGTPTCQAYCIPTVRT